MLTLPLLLALASASPPAPAAAAAPRSLAIERLASQVQAQGPGAVDAFVAGLATGTPMVEPVPGNPARRLVTFLWRGKPETRRVSLFGGRPSTDWETALEKLPGSDLWYVTEALPADSRFAYWFSVDGLTELPDDREGLLAASAQSQLVSDPLNPRKLDDYSYVVLPDAPPFPHPPNAQAAKGSVSDATLPSRLLGADITLRVYLPATPARPGPRRPWLVVAFDGGFEDMATVLDDLVASGRVPPLVVVGVVNREGMRVKDLGFSDDFARFVADELIPWARGRYRTSSDREETILAGYSRGGGMAAYTALRHPDRIGKVLAISTALENIPGGFPPARFWLDDHNGWLIERFIEAPRQKLELFIAAGRFDTSLWTDRLVNNRRFRDVLRARGYLVRYAEWHGGHDDLLFQLGYVTGLPALTTGK